MGSSSGPIVIIGGGAVGLCSAFYLNESGAEVIVVDRNAEAEASSMHNAGYVCPSHFIPLASPGIIAQGLKWMLNPSSPFYVRPRPNRSFLAWALRFYRSCTPAHVEASVELLRDLGNASLALYEEFSRVEGMRFGFTRRGLLILYRTEAGKKGCEEEANEAGQIGVEARMLGADAVRDLEPGVDMRVPGGLYFPGDAHLIPADFMGSLRSLLERKGIRFLKAEATGFRTNGGAITSVLAGQETLRAGQVVLAAGSWSPVVAAMLGIRLLVEAGKGYSITIPEPPVLPSVPFILSEARVAVTPMGSTLRFAGTMELAGRSLTITNRRVEAIKQAVPSYVGGFEAGAFSQARVWAGLRPVSPDGLPYVGRSSAYGNLVVATGHAMIGMSLAPITGKLVAGIASGTALPFNISGLHPDRFA